MGKLKFFVRTFIRTLTEPGYYRDVHKASFSFSLKYLLMLLFLILFVKGLVFSFSLVSFIPKIPGYVEKGKRMVREFYPPELTITVNNGTLRTNVDEPYAIPFPKELNVKDMYFAVIDTKAPIDDAKKYKSVLFVNRNAVAYPDSENKGQYKVYFLTNQKGYFVANKTAYDRTVARILPLFDYAHYMIYFLMFASLLVLPLFGSVFYLGGVMIYLLVLAVLLYIVQRIMGKGLSYSDVYRLSMHGITFSLVFDMLKSIAGITIPFTYTVPFLIWMVLVFNSLKNNNGTSVQAAGPVQ